MKNNASIKMVALLVVAFMGTVLAVTAQRVPKPEEQYIPALFPTDKGISVHWDNGLVLTAEFSPNGDVKEMSIVEGNTVHIWPQNAGDTPFANIDEWKECSRKMYSEFKQLAYNGDQLQWEIHPYTYIGMSTIVGDNDIRAESLVFVRTGRVLSVPRASWRSPLPKANDKLLIGQDYYAKYFFSPSSDGKLPIELMQQLRTDMRGKDLAQH